MARIEIPVGDREEYERMWLLAPDVGYPAAKFSHAVYNNSRLPMRLRELMRMRIALINQCVVCMDTRVASLEDNDLSDDLYAHVTEWATYPGFSDLERAALEYTEKFAIDHLSIDQALLDRLRAELGDELTFELALCVASWLALGRVTQVMDVVASCPLRL
jgi:alkylhydroperoxidase family enzyme